jgi:hypothetical protein
MVMSGVIKTLAGIAVGAVLTTSALAQSAAEVPVTSPIVPIANEPEPKLIVGAPVPEALARGAAVIPYQVENFRIVPVLGAAAVSVSPRVGHLHVSVDDLPWYWGDFSNSNTVVVTALPPGEHKVRIQLADPTHRILATQSVTFTVPGALPTTASDTVPHVH